ncbi:hypothetical protein HYV80_06010 [Candidatus Woesearchaeota archaeon]|nr:hypothetical protein [Candidatus Woesearchaeota archaeon]
MLKFRALIYFFALFFLASYAGAAAIHGSIYDLSLKKINNARVEINTNPKQIIVAQNGTYFFSVPNGDYTLKAQLTRKTTVIASVQENITISQPGDYVLDLILFPDIEEGVEDPGIEVNGDVIEDGNKNWMWGIIIISVLLIVAMSYVVYTSNNRKKPAEGMKAEETHKKEDEYEDDGLNRILKIIKQEGGRTTQKEIRKQIPLSEAKISLMIAELEHKGAIEKIKKGRGNIIILKRK